MQWGVPRKAAETGLRSQAFVTSSEASIRQYAAKLVESCSTDTPVDVSAKYAECALDIVGSLAFKYELGVLEGRRDALCNTLRDYFELTCALYLVPVPYGRWVPWRTDFEQGRGHTQSLVRVGAADY